MARDFIGGRYQILQHLGGGGFGQTYLAQDIHLPGRPHCVVKQLQPKVKTPEALQAARRLFDTEAATLYALGDHPQIPRLLAHFEEAQQFYLVQELIEGQLLSQELRACAPYTEEQPVVALLTDLLRTLAFVHQQQVVHRDIKPSNLIRRQADQAIVVIDFGSVKQLGTLPLQQIEDGQVSITIAVGSMGYMPNEQLAGQPCFSSDIYAVGMLAIQALTGIEPKQLSKDPQTSEIIWRSHTPVSDRLVAIVDRMVRYDFRQRYPSAVEALAALEAYAKGAVDRATPTTAIAPPPPLAGVELEEDDTVMLLPDAGVAGDGSHLIWLERGDEYFQQQRFEAAIACYDKGSQIQPQDYLIGFKRALTLENLHRYVEAIAAYDYLLTLRPRDYLAWYRRGKAAELQQDYDTALASYAQVLTLQPRNYWALQDQGRIYEALEQWEEALAVYNRAVHVKPDFTAAITSRQRVLNRLERVEDLYQLEHYEDAIASCDTILGDRPDDHLAWLMRGMALENLGQHAAAATSYQKVTQLQPLDHLAWYKYAVMLERLEEYATALAAYSQVITLQPDNQWAWCDRGRLLECLGQLEEAMVAYDRAARLKPGFHDAVKHYQRVMTQIKRRQNSAPNSPQRKPAVPGVVAR